MNSPAEWVTAISGVLLVLVAIAGFFATLSSMARTRNRQRFEFDGYVRVDVGPPEGTDDFDCIPDDKINYIEYGNLVTFTETGVPEGSGGDDDAKNISVWYRNLQTNPLGVVLGVFGKVVVDLTDAEGKKYEVRQEHELAYIKPEGCVRVDVVRFPHAWEAEARVEDVEFRNSDGDIGRPWHGRIDCFYLEEKFYMIPWSDPPPTLRDMMRRLWDWMTAEME